MFIACWLSLGAPAERKVFGFSPMMAASYISLLTERDSSREFVAINISLLTERNEFQSCIANIERANDKWKISFLRARPELF
jgi:hypothetical protein